MQTVAQQLDTQTAIKLKLDGRSYKSIGEEYGISKQAVQQRISKLIQGINSDTLKQYNKNEDTILAHAKELVIQHLVKPEVLQKASANNLAYCFGTLNTHQRLNRGDSTSNQSIQGVVAHHNKVLEELTASLAKLEEG